MHEHEEAREVGLRWGGSPRLKMLEGVVPTHVKQSMLLCFFEREELEGIIILKDE